MGNHPSGSQIFRLPQLESILHKVSTHPNHLHMGMAKLHLMAMIQMLPLHKRTAMGVRPFLLGNITVEVPTESRNLLSMANVIAQSRS